MRRQVGFSALLGGGGKLGLFDDLELMWILASTPRQNERFTDHRRAFQGLLRHFAVRLQHKRHGFLQVLAGLLQGFSLV
jgi:hypothetical protein